MKLRETIKTLFRLAGQDYSEYDAMNNNPTPEEEAEKVILSLLKEQREELKKKVEGKKRKLGKHDGHRSDDNCWCYTCDMAAEEKEFTHNGEVNNVLDDILTLLEEYEGR